MVNFIMQIKLVLSGLRVIQLLTKSINCTLLHLINANKYLILKQKYYLNMAVKSVEKRYLLSTLGRNPICYLKSIIW